MIKFFRYFSLAAVAAIMAILIAQPASALSGSDWKPGRIIDDAIFYNKASMTVDQVQQFLNAKVPSCDRWGTEPYGGTTRAAYSTSRGYPPPFTCLKDYQENPTTHENNLEGRSVPAGAKSAAQIIWEAAQDYNINPQALIVLLQKEQGLVLDEWPWPIQYRSATGYGCPDTAACDSQYYGFYNQVHSAAWQFRRYATFPNNYNHIAGQNNNVRYSPNAACGSSTVFIENTATAGLYNYTPYQPNASALANLYGTGDSCGAYGNRNFWRDFNSWFGTSLADGFAVAISDDPNDLRQWVIYGSIKQHIPDSQTKIAWGLQNSSLITMTAAQLNAISTGPSLDRLMRVNGGPDVYFVDAGKHYKVPWSSMLATWNFNSVTISSVSPGLFNNTADGGTLTTSVKDPNTTDIYMLDGRNGSGQTTLRKYQSDTVRQAWEGDGAPYTVVSTDYWDVINDAIGSALTNTKITYQGSEYQVVSGMRLSQPASVAPLYPGVAQSVSPETFNRLVAIGTAGYMVRASSSPDVYIVDGGQKHHVLWPDLMTAWTAPGASPAIVNNAYVSLIPAGSDIDTFLSDAASQLYVLSGGSKLPVPSSLDTAYRNADSVYSASTTLMNLFSSGGQVTGFIKSATEPQVYLLDNSGNRRHIEWADKVTLYGGYQTGITVLPAGIVNSFTNTAASPLVHVSDGTTEYVMEAGKKWTVNTTVKTAWGLNTPQTYTDGTLDRFTTGGAMGSTMRDSSGGYYIMMGGAAYITYDPNIGQVWSLTSATVRDVALPRSLVSLNMLTRYVKSNNGDNRLFVINNGLWYNLTAAWQANFGVSSQPTANINPSYAPNTISDWNSFVVKNGAGDHFVIDGAGKRTVPNATIRNQWTNNGAITVPTVSDGFLTLLPTRGIIERSIKGSAPAVYLFENNTKRHILSPTTYNQLYAPFVQVTDQLINAIPNGSDI